MNRGFHLAKIANIDIYLDFSLTIIFLLITVSLGSIAFPAWHPQWSAFTTWTTAVTAAVLFLTSVLLHEMSHALVGRRFGVDVPRITLFVFGGMAQMSEEPRTWKAELWMAAAGPAMSLLIGATFIALGAALAGDPGAGDVDPERFLASLSPLATLCWWLGPVNVLLAVFNLVPGFPLDGGRVLRAALWGATGDMVKATRWASSGGRLFGGLLIATGIAMVLGIQVPIFGAGLLGGIWLALIGWFLHNAALASYRHLLLRESLLDVPVARLMRRAPLGVAADLPVRRLVDEYFLRGDYRAVPVVDADRLLGIVSLADVRSVPRDDWDGRTAADVMTPFEKLAAVRPDDDGFAALSMLGSRNVNQVPVVDSGRLVGLIAREDILRWLAVYGDERLDLQSRQP